MTLILAFSVMALVAVGFILWRLGFPVEPETNCDDDLASNRELYLEKLSQLKIQRTSGEISQEQFHALELEYQRQFLVDNPDSQQFSAGRGGKALVILIALLVLPLAAVIYDYLGASKELKLRAELEERSDLFKEGKVDSPEMAESTAQVLQTLDELAVKYPDNPTYHVLLARLYTDEGQFEGAVPHYVKATVLLPEDGMLLAEYAQVLFFAAGNQMTTQVRALALRALQLSPMNQIALSLAGIASFQDAEYQRAIEYWNRALSLLPANAPSRVALESGIAAAREHLGEQQVPAGIGQERVLTVQVSPAEEIPVAGDVTVFVYARTWQGSPMPLAIKKLRVSDLPTEVKLTEAMAMSSAMSLATVDQVEVVARVSLTGSPTPAPGDYQASVGPIDVKKQAKPISLSRFTLITE